MAWRSQSGGLTPPPPPRSFPRPAHRLKNTAGKPQSGIAPDGATEHILYTSRNLRSKIHAPLRATQFGNDNVGKMVERVLNGGWFEHLAIAGEMFQNQDLDQIFGNPKYTRLLLENIPMANLIRGVPEILAKDTLTEQDVSLILSSSGRLSCVLRCTVWWGSKGKEATALTRLLPAHPSTMHRASTRSG